MADYEINLDWEPYYQMLEQIRQSGITNMCEASPYLAKLSNISEALAHDVLLSWISNYDELNEKYGWQ